MLHISKIRHRIAVLTGTAVALLLLTAHACYAQQFKRTSSYNPNHLSPQPVGKVNPLWDSRIRGYPGYSNEVYFFAWRRSMEREIDRLERQIERMGLERERTRPNDDMRAMEQRLAQLIDQLRRETGRDIDEIRRRIPDVRRPDNPLPPVTRPENPLPPVTKPQNPAPPVTRPENPAPPVTKPKNPLPPVKPGEDKKLPVIPPIRTMPRAASDWRMGNPDFNRFDVRRNFTLEWRTKPWREPYHQRRYKRR